MINLCLIDIFTVLGKMRESLQKVEQFPWDILKTQSELNKTLRSISNIQLTVLNEERFEGNFDKELWIKLNEDSEKWVTQVFHFFQERKIL